MHKTKLIEILGESVLLSERYANDIAISSQVRMQGDQNIVGIQQLLMTLTAGLRYSIQSLKWYQFRKQIVYRWKFRAKYLFKHLALNSELSFFASEVYRLEGIDIDKLVEDEKKKIEQTEQNLTSNSQ